MDITINNSLNYFDVEYNTLNISTFLDFIKLPLKRLTLEKKPIEEYILLDSINFLIMICDTYFPKISSLLKENNELSNTLFYDFMNCWSMINHIFISLNKITNEILNQNTNIKLSEKDMNYINSSLKFIEEILNDFSKILNSKLFDLQNNEETYEDNYKQFKSKLNHYTIIFNKEFYTGKKEPTKQMKKILSTEFIENEFNWVLYWYQHYYNPFIWNWTSSHFNKQLYFKIL